MMLFATLMAVLATAFAVVVCVTVIYGAAYILPILEVAIFVMLLIMLIRGFRKKRKES